MHVVAGTDVVMWQLLREDFKAAGSDSVFFINGNLHSIAAGRLAFVLDLHGPSVAMDTGCSSSLVACHATSRAMHNSECALGIAAGVNVSLDAGGPSDRAVGSSTFSKKMCQHPGMPAAPKSPQTWTYKHQGALRRRYRPQRIPAQRLARGSWGAPGAERPPVWESVVSSLWRLTLVTLPGVGKCRS